MSLDSSRWQRLNAARFYGILDLGYLEARDPMALLQAWLAGGVEIVQLRGKKVAREELLDLAIKIAPLIHRAGALFIVNDDPVVARESGADGVHIGQDDGVIDDIRALLAPGQLVGCSTHSLAQAIAAEEEGADYIGAGPLFATPTKPDYVPVGLELIQSVAAKVTLPQFCIGGVNEQTLPSVVAAGAKRVVIVSALFSDPNPEEYCRRISKILDRQRDSRMA